MSCVLLRYFYPRPPRGGRQENTLTYQLSTMISIHALREEGDAVFPLLCLHDTYFYPRPPRGGRLDSGKLVPFYVDISIHALREEGDCYRRQRRSTSNKFLSTPSARRATAARSVVYSVCKDFYPRPPRGGRPAPDRWNMAATWYFYPRPPRGGRRGCAGLDPGKA